MPELPEVQALAADLSSRLGGRHVERLDLLSFTALKTFDPPASALNGLQVQAVTRHGKFLDCVIGELHLVVHLALAGWIRWRKDAPLSVRPRKSAIAARLVLEDGSGVDFTEAGTKKSLALYLVKDPAEVPGIAQLGPDALAVNQEEFAQLLAGQGKARIKTVLRKQSVLAGIGNAYSDEILHAARMSPFHPADMNDDDAARLYAAMRQVLLQAIDRTEGHPASELKKEKKSGVSGKNVCTARACHPLPAQPFLDQSPSSAVMPVP